MSESGSARLILGPMYSGKTTELLRRRRKYVSAGVKVLSIKYCKDVRYDAGDAIVTHDMIKSHGAVLTETLAGVDRMVDGVEVICIDEGQFFPDIVAFVDKWANQGKVVIVAALDGDFLRRPFGRVLELIPLAEQVIKLQSICRFCHGPAGFSKRLTDEEEVEVIGGQEKYVAVCRMHYFNPDSPAPATPVHLMDVRP